MTVDLHERLAQKSPKFADHPAVFLGPPLIIFFDLVLPCIIYYTWFGKSLASWKCECQAYRTLREVCPLMTPEFDRHILGYSILSFGIGELYILIVRVYRLLKHPAECAPLLSRSRWELDATSWVYGVAMICALVPFLVGSTREIQRLYLYSPGFLFAFLAILMFVTILPIKIPIGINSQERQTRIRPFIYYACEDFISVDGLQDREFRIRYNYRYENSRAFRSMMFILTLWWLLGIIIYLGVLTTIIWTLDFHVAFGLSLGILFSWMFIWAASSYLYFLYRVRKQRELQNTHT